MSIQSWACSEFSRLGHPNAKEIVSYLLEIEDDSFMEEYLNAMLDSSDPSHICFMKEFVKRRNEVKFSLAPGFYRKAEIEEDDKADKIKVKNKDKFRQQQQQQLTNQQLPPSQSLKKKKKFVSLYSEEGQNKDVILLPGRHKCDCQASKHKLINNCLECGRIVCEQEGSGPCAFCKNLVVSKEEKDFINRGTKKSEALHKKLIHSKKIIDTDHETFDRDATSTLQKAIDHKNKLLEYDKTSEKRTKVYDDESDYFQTSSKWLNPADKEKLRKLEDEKMQMKYDRNHRKVTIDLLGRTIIAADDINIYDSNDPLLKDILESDTSDIYSFCNNEELIAKLNIDRPIYVDDESALYISHKQDNHSLHNLHRLQDKELQEMRDEGMCLSMHQPWASLLVAGIKVHEGRTWYSSHRGRLWIAAAAKIPTEEDICQVEQTYKLLLNNTSIKFPKYYPTGCLLGCIDVIDVLPQEQYKIQYPGGESDSPYVFICNNPQEMKVKFPLKGQHKIFKLELKIHLTAKKSLK